MFPYCSHMERMERDELIPELERLHRIVGESAFKSTKHMTHLVEIDRLIPDIVAALKEAGDFVTIPRLHLGNPKV